MDVYLLFDASADSWFGQQYFIDVFDSAGAAEQWLRENKAHKSEDAQNDIEEAIRSKPGHNPYWWESSERDLTDYVNVNGGVRVKDWTYYYIEKRTVKTVESVTTI